MYKVPPKKSLVEMENDVSDFWKKNEIFKKSVEQRSEKNKYVFVDGPPFVTGNPHYATLLPSIAKDVIPRYFAMKGKRVRRDWGW
ncbi:class I tRNA ligase family protein, partial [Patescibacteria group bacterium]|nr:class I tRNA ligase family protein [Patescibacteria group bacterium]